MLKTEDANYYNPAAQSHKEVNVCENLQFGLKSVRQDPNSYEAWKLVFISKLQENEK